MSGSSRKWLVMGLALTAVGAVAMVSCAPVGLVGATVTGVSVAPASMGYGGGQATVTATVQGTGAVSGAAVYPDDKADAISMTPVSTGSSLYRGTVPIRPNVTVEPMTVTVLVRVLDPDTKELLDYGYAEVTVGAAPSPPPDPPSI